MEGVFRMEEGVGLLIFRILYGHEARGPFCSWDNVVENGVQNVGWAFLPVHRAQRDS
jgi:hypothetical protein